MATKKPAAWKKLATERQRQLTLLTEKLALQQRYVDTLTDSNLRLKRGLQSVTRINIDEAERSGFIDLLQDLVRQMIRDEQKKE